jgi:hypothetical protein
MTTQNWSITIDTPSEGSTSNFMDVGIHENVELTNIRYDVSAKGKEFMEFTFTAPDSRELKHTEWKPGATDEKMQIDLITNQLGRIKQLATKFIPKEKFVLNAVDFKSFASNVIMLIGNSYKGVKLRLKAVYNKEGYITLPNSWKSQFVERMDLVPLESTKIRILPSDKMVRPEPTQRQASPSSADLFGTVAEATKPTKTGEDWPF